MQKISFGHFILIILIFSFLAFFNQKALAYTANKVWFEFRPHNRYRVYVNYTIPSLKEYREAYAEFKNKKEAESFYWDLIKGADFYLPDPKSRKFISNPAKPAPW